MEGKEKEDSNKIFPIWNVFTLCGKMIANKSASSNHLTKRWDYTFFQECSKITEQLLNQKLFCLIKQIVQWVI